MTGAPLIFIVLVFVAVCGITLYFFFEKVQASRQEKLMVRALGREALSARIDQQRVNENTLTESVLQSQLRAANIALTERQFLAIVWSVPISIFLGLIFYGIALIIASLVAFCIAIAAPRIALIYLKRRRTKLFNEKLPWALDVVVRGARAGLPISECVRVVALEGAEPIATEFRSVLQDQAVGRTMPEAFANMASRIGTQESHLLGIVMTIQQQTGGNIADVLQSFADSIRARQALIGRIDAITAESKTSAWLLSALPFAAYRIVSKTFPDKTALLFTTPLGNIMLAATVIWMALGIYMIFRMVDIKV
jgi:tight adherence protein B